MIESEIHSIKEKFTENLNDTQNDKPNPSDVDGIELITRLAVQLTFVEVFLGSVLHGLKIPFGGHFLSLNQGLFLLRSVSPSTPRIQVFKMPNYISSVVGTLKCLSPAGNKLGPMTSITVQGFLFSIGVAVFGVNLFGQIFGMLLLSLWAFFQPILTLYIIFGSDLWDAFFDSLSKLQKIIPVTNETLWMLFGGVIAFKFVLAIIVVVIYRLKTEEQIDEWANRISAKAKSIRDPNSGSKGNIANQSIDHSNFENQPTSKNSDKIYDLRAFKGAIKDIFKPFFLFSIALMFFFFYSSGNDWGGILVNVLRPIGLGFLLFYIMRLNIIRPLINRAMTKGLFPKFFFILDRVVKRVF